MSYHYWINQKEPRIEEGCFIAENAVLIGEVVLKARASVWFNAVIRGDNDLIEIGEASNIQDGAILHNDAKIPLVIGRGVTVGHAAVLHSCEIADDCLIGIGAVILNGARIGRHCLVGARSLITPNQVIPERSLVLGSPAKVIRAVTDEEVVSIEESARTYLAKRERYLQSLVQIRS